LTVAVVTRLVVSVAVSPLKTWTVSPVELALTLDDVSVCVAVKTWEPLVSELLPVVVTVTLEPVWTTPVAIAVVPPSA